MISGPSATFKASPPSRSWKSDSTFLRSQRLLTGFTSSTENQKQKGMAPSDLLKVFHENGRRTKLTRKPLTPTNQNPNGNGGILGILGIFLSSHRRCTIPEQADTPSDIPCELPQPPTGVFALGAHLSNIA